MISEYLAQIQAAYPIAYKRDARISLRLHNININELSIMSDILLNHMLGLVCHIHWKVYFMDWLKMDQNNNKMVAKNCTEKVFTRKQLNDRDRHGLWNSNYIGVRIAVLL